MLGGLRLRGGVWGGYKFGLWVCVGGWVRRVEVLVFYKTSGSISVCKGERVGCLYRR